MASTFAERRTLRRIPLLHSLSRRELDELHERTIFHSYRAGDVIWRTRGPLRWNGYLQSGEVELEYRVDGVLVRTTRLVAGDPLPPRSLQSRRLHNMVVARAITDVRIGILPDTKQIQEKAAVQGTRRRSLNWLWPVLLLLLVILLAREDLLRITSGLLYLASTRGDSAAMSDPRSMSLLRAAQRMDMSAAFAYNEEGYRLFQQKNLSGAAAALSEAVARDPVNASALNNLGISQFTQGDWFLAAHSLQQAVEQSPDNATARYNLGIALMQIQDSAGAIREFREAGFIETEAAWPQLQQAFLYQQIGDDARAEQRARSAIQLDPALVPAHLLLGIALYGQGREDEALPSFQEALKLDPGNRVAAFYQALIFGHQKQYEQALSILHLLFLSSTDPAETVRILAEMDALDRLRAESTAARP